MLCLNEFFDGNFKRKTQMKYSLNLIVLILLLVSCGKGKEPNNAKDNSNKRNFYQINSINGVDQTTGKYVEVQIYESATGDKFINQVRQFKNEEIDSSDSYFYTLESRRIEPNTYKGKIQVLYENEKILGIEFKTLAEMEGEVKTLTFNSDNSNHVLFNMTNTGLIYEIKGVLRIKIETEILIEGKKEKGYYIRNMFVDNTTLTDNIFIKKYKK